MSLKTKLSSGFIVGLLLSAAPFSAFPSPYPIQKHQVMDGVNVDICLIDPTSRDYVINSKNQDLIDIAHHLGINLFRLTDGGCGHGKANTNAWNMVLRKMEANGIAAIVTMEPPLTGLEMTPDSVKAIMSTVIDNRIGTYRNIYGVDIINEPVIDDNNISFIKQTISQIKSTYPDLRLSVGGWRTRPGSGTCPVTITDYCWNHAADGKVFSGLLDYFSVHIYGYDRPLNGPYPDPFTHTAQFLDAILPFTQDKPIIIEEYGAANGTAVTDQLGLGTPELQANVTAGVLRAVRAYRNKNIIGSTQWAFYNRSYQNGTSGWEIVINNGETILPAGYVIQHYSTGKSDKALTLPMPIKEKLSIFRNTDNGKTVSLRQNDIAGFIFNLDKSGTYSFVSGNPMMFVQSEPFTHKIVRNYYTTTLHASSPGTTTVKVIRNDCIVNCQMFVMTLSVLPRETNDLSQDVE